MPDTAQLYAFIASELENRLTAVGLSATDLTPELDLFASGVVDSLQFVELLGKIESSLGVEIDLLDVDPERLTTVGGLIEHVCGT